MKKLLALLLALLLLVGGSAFAEETGLTKDIVVLFTSDVHCGIDQGFGYAGLAAVRDTMEKSSHVLLVDNGDAIQGEPIGTMTTGEAIIGLMNDVGYDVAIPGNHEFDYGMDRFLELTEMADFLPPNTSRMTRATLSTASCRMRRAKSSTPPCSPPWTRPSPRARTM